MKKSLVFAGAALLAASMVSLAAPTTAHAKKGFHFHFGGGHHHHHHHRRHHHIVLPPVQSETYRVRKPAVVAVPQKKVVVANADGKGRVFDPASKSWFDGQGSCWSGQMPWSYKAGAWFYGKTPWTQSGDTWSTAAADAPIAIECQTVPAFAKAPGSGPKDLGGYSSDPSGSGPPARSAEEPKPANSGVASGGDPASPGGCRKNFPSVGENVTAACTN